MSALIHLSDPGIHRTKKGLRYERFRDEIKNMFDGASKEDEAKVLRANLSFLRGIGMDAGMQKGVTPNAVHQDQLLTNLSIQYANDEYIGLRLMPFVTVNNRSDIYAVYNKRDRFAFPDDLIGYRSSSNELNETRTTANYSVVDRGFKNYLDLETVQNEDAPLNEMVDVVEAINEGMAFKREQRISALLQNSANFGGNTAAVGAGTAKWDEAGGTGGTIIADILGAVSAIYAGPNPTRLIGFTSLAVWNSGIANNPKIRALFSSNGEGLATSVQVARFFGLDDILIGRARQDTANEGQTAAYSRMWTSDNFGIVRVANSPTTRSLHWGTTFQMRGDPFTTQWTDPSIGKRGGIYARVASSEDYKVVAPDAGFLITDVLT